MIRLTAIREDDYEVLCAWRNNPAFQNLCGQQQNQLTLEEFRSELSSCFARGRHWQCIIRKQSDRPLGTIFSYGYSRRDQYCFVTIYIDDTARVAGLGVNATLMFAEMLCNELSIRKVYFEVHEYNISVVAMLQRVGLAIEGRFLGHRLLDGVRYDTFRFALYVDDIHRLKKMYNRWDHDRIDRACRRFNAA